jgi:hypothetical protein
MDVWIESRKNKKQWARKKFEAIENVQLPMH